MSEPHGASGPGRRPEPATVATPGGGPVTGAAPPPAVADEHRVHSTATDELMRRLTAAPKLDPERYELEGPIDQGGMGAILRIRDRHLNRRLAMKVMLEREAPRDDYERQLAHQFLGRFLEEAQVTSQLDHPGVVPVHELGLDQRGKVFFTMKLVKGRTAGQVFAAARAGQHGWTTMRALEVVLKVCDTMAFAHDKGILHRDLKPDNVMVGRFGEVYVMDWGLAKVRGEKDRHDLRIESGAARSHVDSARRRDAESDDGSSVVSMDGQRLGTPSYMPPEQARSEELDERADVYAIGAMLYELLTGRAPYTTPGLVEPAYRILRDVVEGPPKPVLELAKDTPPALIAITEKAMARAREDRYPDTQALAADLRAFVEQRAVRAYRTGALVELSLWIRRNRALAASLAAAVAILAVGVVVASLLARDNAALAAQKTELAASETRAKEAAAAQAERLAASLRDFDHLAAVVQHDRAVAAEAELYPARPHMVAALEAWLADVDVLLQKQPAIRATVAQLRATALPATAAELEADRRSHPRLAELEAAERELAALEHAQRTRDGRALPTVELPESLRAASLSEQAVAARQRVGALDGIGLVKRTIYGQEALGLALARVVLQRYQDGDRTLAGCQAFETLAWALFANGQDEATLQAADAAIAAATIDRQQHEADKRHLEALIAGRAARIAALRDEVATLGPRVRAQRTFRFAAGKDGELASFLHRTLTGLDDGLERLRDLRADVARRHVWAERIAELTRAHPNARHSWAEVRTAVKANPRYAGRGVELPDEQVVGLVPIGENPVTHLWEFYELRSAWDGVADPAAIPIPEHRADGSIEVGAATGIVFVLLPGGPAVVGAQAVDADAPRYDPRAQLAEQPVHAEMLAPFLLARHELTRGQWRRLTGTAPFWWAADLQYDGDPPIGDAHPADSMRWSDAELWLERSGMALPTEAQWEYGARGDTETPWWTGADERSLAGAENVLDETAVAKQPGWGRPTPIADGFVGIAPVGSFRANPFGLFDVHGNVGEWCADRYWSYGNARPLVDQAGIEGYANRSIRGGNHARVALFGRSSARSEREASGRQELLGLRAARALGR